MKNKNHIGIVFGGYVDENNKLMDRMELNRRIAYLQRQVSELTIDKILEILKSHTKEMEGYSYFGSNPGVSEDDYDDIAKEIIAVIKGA